jgi:hypothetical protein
MSTRKRPIVLTPSPEGAASAAAATMAIGAVACGVCCVLPFARPAVLLASSGGVLGMFAQAFWGALYLSTAMVAGAWLWVLAGQPPHREATGASDTDHDGHRDRCARRRGHVAHSRASRDRCAQGVCPMTMTRRTLLSLATLVAPAFAAGQTPATHDEYTPSDPTLIGRTGRPQLVEFFHPR